MNHRKRFDKKAFRKTFDLRLEQRKAEEDKWFEDKLQVWRLRYDIWRSNSGQCNIDGCTIYYSFFDWLRAVHLDDADFRARLDSRIKSDIIDKNKQVGLKELNKVKVNNSLLDHINRGLRKLKMR